MVIKIASRMSS